MVEKRRTLHEVGADITQPRPPQDLGPGWSVLMGEAQAGDREAYRQLLRAITPYLRKIVAQHHRAAADIEDTIQDILLTVHSIRHTYDPSRPFGPWLKTIARRRIIDRLRQQGRSRSRETPLEPRHETFAEPRTNLHERASDERALREAVAKLPQNQRRAITLLKMEEMSLKEASAVTGMSVISLKVSTHRAMKTLRRMLAKRSDET